ncbi:AraC family transcriptional activator of pobA [Chryseobacterium sp. H1D6B]|uniref:helix-turn-helix domain-containing protein n=1 Tax=Chryseobacterium sp. H1D6B TaxID=2940588 RepID=UPI0015C7744D|nr:AraC family transcriptional regulator [Chryseobacterium sp. H1D6B]MDH6253442.1 AraC family transcriptional activator of pobA [Chryseobacterium sp. H1D6B]
MKKNQNKIQQFQLSPLAKAGIAIKNLGEARRDEDHDSSKPHRDYHYLLMLATNGSFRFTIDFQEIIISMPALLLISPGQVHHTMEMKAPEGWAIAFDPSLMDPEILHVMEKSFQGPVTLDLQSNFYHHVVTLVDLMAQLQSSGLNGHSVQAQHSLLDALLDLIAEKLTPQPAAGSQTTFKRAAIIEQTFNQLLKQHYKTWKQPAQYAAELHISVAHLYEIVKGITGNSVSLQIQQYSILEAKRLLYLTNLSVKEISYELGYDEPVYFGKLFKKITSLTPLQFRQQYRD